MRVFVTGASGFLGTYVTSAAVEAGHEVTALVRPASRAVATPGARVVTADLRHPGGLDRVLADLDAVIHLAASVGGGFHDQLQSTVVATDRLLDAMVAAGTPHLVLAGSIAVYDYRRLGPGDLLAPSSPLEGRPADRDSYTQTKLLQERLVRDRCEAAGITLSVLRPGIIIGADHLYSDWIALRWGHRLVVVGPQRVLPLTEVHNCARAFVETLDAPRFANTTFNVIDDSLPTVATYLEAVETAFGIRIPKRALPARPVRALSRFVWDVNQRLAGGRLNLPLELNHPRLSAITGDLRFTSGFDEHLSSTTQVLTWKDAVRDGSLTMDRPW